MTKSAEVWCNNFVDTTRSKKSNIHGFLCLLRCKLIPKISQDVLCKPYLGYHHAQLGINVPVNQYAQGLEQYQIRCLDNEGKPMISNYVYKVKFVDGLLPWIRDKVRPMVDWRMKYDAIVAIAERIQSIYKPGGTHSGSLPRKPNPDKQLSAGKPMQFTKSDCMAPPIIEAAKEQGAPHPVAGDSIDFVHFPNAKPDNTNYKPYGTRTDMQKEQLANEGQCFFCKQSGHLAGDCMKKKISSNTMQVRYKLGHKIKSARVVIEDKKTASLQVAKLPTDKRMHSLPLSNKILNAAETRINGARANMLIDPCTVGADLISAQFCHLYNILREEMPPKSLFTAIKGSKSTMNKKATIGVDLQGHKEITTFLVSNLMDWDAIIGHTILHHFNTGMNVKDNRVSIQARGHMRYDLNVLDRVTEIPVMQAAAIFTEDYDSPYNSPILYDSSSHAYDIETDEDTTDSSANDSEEEPALSHQKSNTDSEGRPEEQGYQMLDETPSLHPWLACDSTEDMIAQAQSH